MKKSRFRSILKYFLVLLVAILILLNLFVLLTGRTYLYKGIQETYLKGKKGPDIYDSIIFPTRTAKHDLHPEAWKINPKLIPLDAQAISFMEGLQTTSFLVIKNQEIISETYFEKHTIHTKSNSFSAGKSLIGLLIGIAIDEGKISSFDALIKDYLPFRMPNDEGVTIRDVLAMSSDLVWEESGKNPLSDNAEAYYSSDLIKVMKSKGFAKEKTHDFNYKSGNTELLGLILKEATGKYPTEYLEEKVWSKIGTENDLLWSLDQENGMEKAFCCAYATTRDFAKFGQLILNYGKWNGKTIIDSTTLTELITPISEASPFYGLQFWIYHDPQHPAIYARGILGQYIVAIPSLNVVMVRTGHKRQEDQIPVTYNPKIDYKSNHPGDIPEYYTILMRILEQTDE